MSRAHWVSRASQWTEANTRQAIAARGAEAWTFNCAATFSSLFHMALLQQSRNLRASLIAGKKTAAAPSGDEMYSVGVSKRDKSRILYGNDIGSG